MYIADLHIHSKYSRATSRDCDAPHLDLWARMKGVELVGTGDFTHPTWRSELAECLEPAETGLYRLRSDFLLPCRVNAPSPRFVVTGEISTIYKKDGKTRKVHHLIILPSLEAADEIAKRLEIVGNIRSDGRPILGIDSRDLARLVFDACGEAIFIPAHIWTPHFSLFGAFSDFSALEECYGEMSPRIHALETGLSSDPPMNRRVSMLDGYHLVSNSDAHSPTRLAREANIMDCEMSYPALKRALDTGEGLHGTIEFFPEEGKYHLDGHRNCGIRLTPEETLALGGRCPVCGKKLTVGVEHRVNALADRADAPQNILKPFESLMPLPELLADCLGTSAASKRTQAAFATALERLGSELNILREAPISDISAALGPMAGEAVRRLRARKVIRSAGYDGEYGKITLFEPYERDILGGQLTFLDMTAPAPKTRRPVAAAKAAAPDVPDTAPSIGGENPEQQNAITCDARAIAVVAGPGTGKTHTLVSRVEHLIKEKGVRPSEITVVTFTNQAAAELRQRLEQRLGGRRALKGLTVGTFHSICLRLIPEKPLAGRTQAMGIIKSILGRIGADMDPADCLDAVSARRNGAESAPELPDGIIEEYRRSLEEAGVRDLDDVIAEALETDASGLDMFKNLFIDEYQDINSMQRRLVAHWAEGGGTVFAIGDPDQSIYGFRGASAGYFDELRDVFPDLHTITLTRNYRSAAPVIETALSVIAHNPGAPRRLVALRGAGDKVRLVSATDVYSEGVWIAAEIGRMAGGVDMLSASHRDVARAFSDIAILCRTRSQLSQIEAQLAREGIPCVILGRSEGLCDESAQGILCLLNHIINPDDLLALTGALRGIWHMNDDQIKSALSGADFPESAVLNHVRETIAGRMAKEKPAKILEMVHAMTGIRARFLDDMAVFHRDMASFMEALASGEEGDVRRRSGAGAASGAVTLMTLHGSKGLEFPVVFLAGVEKGALPLERHGEETNIQEERRLFFVGITRARDELIISHSGEPSPFIGELPGDIIRERAPEKHKKPLYEQLSFM